MSVSSSPSPERLRRLLGGDDLTWLVRRVRDRLEAGRPLTGAVTLASATAAQRQAVSRLTGRAVRAGASLSVSLDAVDAMLRSSGAAPGGLAEAVAVLTGPVRDLAGERASSAAAWSSAFAPLDALVADGELASQAGAAGGEREALRSWRAWLDATGVVRRLAPAPSEAAPLLRSVASVVRRLPSPGVPLGRLAAECCGDAHALDDGRPAGTLALSAARALAGLPFSASSGTGSSAAADTRRSVWAAVGVHLDELSSTVLCLGLPGGPSPLGAVLGACRASGQPVSLTLRQLRCHSGSLAVSLKTGGGLVRICENPVVVAAAADELGASCAPLVCVGGQPSAAAWRLLSLLASGGASFAYHGDFDWGGARIAEAVRTRTGWTPWRYDRAAYLAHAPETSAAGTGALTGTPTETPWDPGLAAAMRERGLRVEEELTLDTLLADLGDSNLSVTQGNFSRLAGAAISAAVLSVMAVPPASAASRPNGDVSVNLFEWNWKSVAAECVNHLGPAGAGSVQVAPPEESADLPGQPWDDVYAPVSYKLDSRMGNETQFAAMVTACHGAGVAVIADAVLNHMAGGNTTITGYGGSTATPPDFSYPAAGYGSADFHHNGPGGACPTSDDQVGTVFNGPSVVWNCELDGLPDLATGTARVRSAEARYLNHLISLGVDGFRLDAAQWMPPGDIAALSSKLHKTTWQHAAPYLIQEVHPGSTSPDLQYSSYEGNGPVIDFTYAYDLKYDFDHGDLASLNTEIGSNSNGNLPSGGKSLDVVANHDTERDGSTLNNTDGAAYTLANYFMLAYPYGTPQIYDGFTFPASDKDQSPPSDSSGMVSDVTDATCGTQWQCLHREPGVIGMIGWHNAVGSAPVENWTSSGGQVIAFSRGSKGWIAINDTASPVTKTYATGLPDGTYCDVITGGAHVGGCTGTPVTVSRGQASVTVPADSAVALDVNSKS